MASQPILKFKLNFIIDKDAEGVKQFIVRFASLTHGYLPAVVPRINLKIESVSLATFTLTDKWSGLTLQNIPRMHLSIAYGGANSTAVPHLGHTGKTLG